MKTLVAEDDGVTRRWSTAKLTDGGYEVVNAGDGWSLRMTRSGKAILQY